MYQNENIMNNTNKIKGLIALAALLGISLFSLLKMTVKQIQTLIALHAMHEWMKKCYGDNEYQLLESLHQPIHDVGVWRYFIVNTDERTIEGYLSFKDGKIIHYGKDLTAYMSDI